MRRAVLMAIVLVVSQIAPAPVAQAQSQATVVFYNNLTTPVKFGVDDPSGYICRIFVQYGSCTVHVSPGSHTLIAKEDNDALIQSEDMVAEAGKGYSWTIYPKK